MDDAGAMRRVERARDLDGQRERGVDWQRPLCQPSLSERLAVEQLHHEERRAVVLADVVQRADVRMGQLRDRARFAIEALAELRIGGERGGQHLDGDRAVEPRVARAIDLAHPAGAEGRQDLVRAEFRSRGQHVNRPIK